MVLLHHIPALNAKRIVLASGSPRRREMLSNIGLKFEVLVSSFEEKLPKDKFPSGGDYALETARHKALDVVAMCASREQQQQPQQREEEGPQQPQPEEAGQAAGGAGQQPTVDLIVSADTVVEANGQILEKPDDAEHAFQMISSLSGREHLVHTGVVLVLPQVPDPATGQPPYVRSFTSTTSVTFAPLSDEVIRAYVASGEPFGKAGAYGIQGAAGSFVVGISGCFYNVVGFPLHRFCAEVLSLVQEGLLEL